jgi:hypothetical protein
VNATRSSVTAIVDRILEALNQMPV